MKMQDDQFDELFRSKLEGFEAEPSHGVWERIADHLGGEKSRISLFPFIGIAASILVLVVAGVLFIPQKVKVSSKNLAHNTIANAQTKNVTPTKNKTDETLAVPKNRPYTHTEVNKRSFHFNSKNITRETGSSETELNPVKAAEAVTLATLPQQHEIITPVVPDETTELTTKRSLSGTDTFVSKPALLSAQVPVVTTPDVVPGKQKRHAIHSFGDLVNVVVAKVDKRRDKFIEFSDADDDQSNVTGINLGVIKIKREK
ncbi:MAG: hypothetical protein NVSMB24_21030 [Mucilaginibacter sp.]